jgi:PAS domain S-box-containing protein
MTTLNDLNKHDAFTIWGPVSMRAITPYEAGRRPEKPNEAMRDSRKTKTQLMSELENLRHRCAWLEAGSESPLATDALLRQGGLLRTLARNFPDGAVAVFDKALRFQLVEGKALRHLDLTPAAIEGKSLGELLNLSDRDLIEQRYRRVLAGETLTVENVYRQRCLLTHYIPLRDVSNTVIGGAVLALDITERKEAEEKIKSALNEKEILLREIHHRVKNNMQVILSLLNLQAANQSDQRVKALFEELRNRINAMALIHETLYQSESLTRINLQAYVQGLATALLRMYETQSRGIDLSVQAQGVFINLDQAVPCGLIINELISNALKYAFPEGRFGQIRVEAADQKSMFDLSVSDNGIGLPENLDVRRVSSLGLRLVVGLAESQLGGSIEIGRGPGTRFHIRFPQVDRNAP